MADTITALGDVLSRDMTKVTLHSTNIANANTVGFRQRIAGGDNLHAVSDSPGTLRATGRPLDIAIVGDGWLVESGTDGTRFLTRNGRLAVAPDGYLTGAGGNRIMGTHGPVFVGTSGNGRIDHTGVVHVDAVQAGQLLLVKTPATIGRLLPDGRYAVAELPETAGEARVISGVLEYSNVDIAGEMAQLLMTSRHLESTQRALQLYDNTIGSGIGQIGKE